MTFSKKVNFKKQVEDLYKNANQKLHTHASLSIIIIIIYTNS